MLIGKGYRTLMILAIILVCPFLFQCLLDSDNEEPGCNQTKKPRIEPLMRIYLNVRNTPDSAYAGPAKVQFEKVYCNGNHSGAFRDSTDSMTDGFWKPISTQYILENEKDRVDVYLYIDGHSNLGTSYQYQQVADKAYIDDTFQLVFDDTLEWVFNIGR